MDSVCLTPKAHHHQQKGKSCPSGEIPRLKATGGRAHRGERAHAREGGRLRSRRGREPRTADARGAARQTGEGRPLRPRTWRARPQLPLFLLYSARLAASCPHNAKGNARGF